MLLFADSHAHTKLYSLEHEPSALEDRGFAGESGGESLVEGGDRLFLVAISGCSTLAQ